MEEALAYLPEESRRRLAQGLDEFTSTASKVSEAYAEILENHAAR